jgi:large subunit ribosomal protein L9
MEVILLERVEKLGQMGDVVNVKSGFARNYLLPQKKAVTATETNKKQFEERRSHLEAQNLEMKGEAEKVSSKLEGLVVSMIRQAGDAGQLYGSVNARDIATGVTEAGFTVARRQVNLDQPIKAVGLHPVRIALHPEVIVTVKVNVARSAEEAKIQEQTGEAVIRTDEEEEAVEAAAPEEMFEPGAGPAEDEAAEGGEPER